MTSAPDRDSWYRWDGDDLILNLRVQPRARRDELAGPHGASFRVRITAPPVDGKANDHLTRFIAKAFGVTRGDVTLEAGDTSREKRIRVRRPKCLPAAGILPGRAAREGDQAFHCVSTGNNPCMLEGYD